MNRPTELTENEIYLIDILNTMYTNNMTEINALTQLNQEIANNIFSISMRSRIRRNRSSNLRPTTAASSNRNNLPSNFVIEYIYNIPPVSNEEVTDAPTIPTFFDSITVHPTHAEIERATQTIRFGDIVSPTNLSCPISLESFNENDNVTMIHQCGHIFNTLNINVWFRINVRCPICRFDIRNHVSDRNSQISNTQEEDSGYFTDLIFSHDLTDSSFNIM